VTPSTVPTIARDATFPGISRRWIHHANCKTSRVGAVSDAAGLWFVRLITCPGQNVPTVQTMVLGTCETPKVRNRRERSSA
jgi:hypothetical protein